MLLVKVQQHASVRFMMGSRKGHGATDGGHMFYKMITGPNYCLTMICCEIEFL